MAYTVTTQRTHKARSGIALGGIGAGWFELRQDGICYDWNIFNNKPLGTGPHFDTDQSATLFFLVRYQEKGKTPKMRLLQIENKYNAAGIRRHEHYYIVPWLSGVDQIEYTGNFPFITMRCTDRDMPFVITINAWSPFIPFDEKNSSLPGAVFTLSCTSKTKNPVEIMIVASMRNCVGYETAQRAYKNTLKKRRGTTIFEMTCDKMDRSLSTFGTMGIGTTSKNPSWYLGWEHHHPYYEQLIRNTRLSNINDTAGRNNSDPKTGKKVAMEYCFSSIAASGTVTAKKRTFSETFIVGWNFPNLYARKPQKSNDEPEIRGDRIEGHYYNNFFSTSTDVIAYMADNLPKLHRETARFNDAFFDSTAPAWVLDQVNSHLNTFFAGSWFTREGNFGIIEGLNSDMSFAGLSTTDVAMYASISYATLFPALDKKVMRTYRDFQLPNGKIAHAVGKNFAQLAAGEADSVRLDMPGQYAFMALRAFFLGGDREYLHDIWPSVKKALDYVLRERDINGDGLPDMEGVMCSYDNFPMFGVASYVASQFLAGLKSAIEAARILGDGAAQKNYQSVFEKGLAVFEEKAFNGTYYRLYNDRGGPKNDTDEGCLSDQIIGQWAARQIGLAPLFKPARVKKALKKILAMNYKKEYGLRNCQWPGDGFLHDVDKNTWIDQANTVWTGVELAFASFLLYEGLYDDAMKVMKNVDDRYRRWGMYWDHQEFGGRYFRPMSSWAIVNGLSGFFAADGVVGFAPHVRSPREKLFFAAGESYGHLSVITGDDRQRFTLAPAARTFRFHALHLTTAVRRVAKATVSVNGKRCSPSDYHLSVEKNRCELTFTRWIAVKPPHNVTVTVSGGTH